jgi:uncharacterized protein YjiS (DUF1127 family)
MTRRAIRLQLTIPLPSAVDVLEAPTRGLVVLWRALHRWQARAEERAQLAQMTERQRRDIGVGLDDLRAEANKPFWRP